MRLAAISSPDLRLKDGQLLRNEFTVNLFWYEPQFVSKLTIFFYKYLTKRIFLFTKIFLCLASTDYIGIAAQQKIPTNINGFSLFTLVSSGKCL
jgi:hypothetical protein